MNIAIAIAILAMIAIPFRIAIRTSRRNHAVCVAALRAAKAAAFDAAKRSADLAARQIRAAQREAKRAAKAAAPAKRPAIIPSPAQPVTSSAERPCTVSIPRELQTPLIVHNPGAPIGNNKFYKQVVCFTGTIPGMTRAKAMAAVEANGGTAFEHMPKHPTILVKGDKPGRAKLEAAAALGDACHVIDASVFLGMVSAPLALEPDELIRYLPKLLGKEVAIA